MRTFVPFVTAALLIAADDGTKTELEKFQGTWTVISYEVGGKSQPDEIKNTLVFSGDHWKVKRGDKVLEEGTQLLYADQKPKAMDHTITAGTDKGKTFAGIYELEGDALKFCFAPAGEKRPTEFTAKPAGYYLIVYKRK
jgi:uncharacterized protein (TIGR03067 family)